MRDGPRHLTGTLITLAAAIVAAIAGAIAMAANDLPAVSGAGAPTVASIVSPEPAPSPSRAAPIPAAVAPPSASPAPAASAAATPPPTPSPPPPPGDGGAAVPPVPESLLGTEWERIPSSRRVVALTFDAGANADAVHRVLATLREREVRGTFFLTGSWARRYPVRARRIATTYPVGNHSDTHPDFTTLTRRQVRAEIRRSAQAIVTAGGGDPRPLFRFPYGARNEATIAQANRLGYGSIRWTVDTLGWKGTSGGMSARRVVRRVVGALQPGAIVLMHVGSNPDDGSMLDARALGRVIDAARARGYRFVTLRQAIGWQTAQGG